MGPRTAIFGLISLIVPTLAAAMPPRSITQEERALLPPYCKYAQGGRLGKEVQHAPSEGARHWMAIFGGGEGTRNNHWKIHHYCYAQIHYMRANRAGAKPMQVKEHLNATVEEIDFTIEKVTPDFILMPEMLLYRGRALRRLGRESAATLSFGEAIKIKPDYWPPYIEIADQLVNAGERDKAKEVLDEALKHAPDARPVKERLAAIQARQ